MPVFQRIFATPRDGHDNAQLSHDRQDDADHFAGWKQHPRLYHHERYGTAGAWQGEGIYQQPSGVGYNRQIQERWQDSESLDEAHRSKDVTDMTII